VTADLEAVRSVFSELTALHGWAPLQTPRSLVLALTGRVGAVASLLQWNQETPVGSAAVTPELRDELADCLVYLVALSDALEVNLVDDAVTRLRGAVESTQP
jgi:NTP pyrophosphatase (non-canonical NTP hydrolase)